MAEKSNLSAADGITPAALQGFFKYKCASNPDLINSEETAKMAEEPVLYGLYVDRHILRVPQVKLFLFLFTVSSNVVFVTSLRYPSFQRDFILEGARCFMAYIHPTHILLSYRGIWPGRLFFFHDVTFCLQLW